MELQNVVLVDGARSPFARGGRGALVATRLDEAASTVLRALLARNPMVDPRSIEEIGLGNVMGAGELSGLGANHIARLAGLTEEVCTFDTNRQCGSSMEALRRVAQEIMVGAIHTGVAMGVERMGRQLRPRGGDSEQNRVTEFNRKRLQQTPAQRDPAPDHGAQFSVPLPDYILDSTPVVSMTQTAQNVSEVYGLSRRQLDEFVVESHRKYGEALDAGFYADEIIPLEVEAPVFDDEGQWLPEELGEAIVFDRDEGYRANTNFEKLGGLRPVQGIESFGNREIVITAGNSCPTNDGVSAALLVSETRAQELGLEPLARIIGFGVAGVKPQVMGLGPVPATKKALRHAGISVDEIDRVEFNEAFAAQVIPSVEELGIPLEKVSCNGGSLANGHPLGATGARLVTTVSRELRRSGGHYGLATQCIGAGMGITTIVEAL